MPDTTLHDITWVMSCTALVLLMQAGFCCLETGLVRSKNSINVAVKNLVDFCLSSALFWVGGFALMFGPTVAGLVGTEGFFFNGPLTPNQLTFFLFQLVFCGTAVTIISGAVAERMKFTGYVSVTIIVSGLIYPVFGHWAWGLSASGEPSGWLNSRGFIDFAGSTVVHSVGGWVALAAAIVVGPRLGRFGPNARPIQGHNLPIAAVGTLLLWVGWFGFNGGSTLGLSDSIPLILLNTSLAAVFGGVGGLAVSWWKQGVPAPATTMNGILAGLVSITAACNIVSPAASVAIGLIGGVVSCLATVALERLGVDDVVGAVPVHAAGGAWGTLAVAVFADPSDWGTGLTRWEQIFIQSTGVLVAFVWACGLGLVALRLVGLLFPLRVSAEDERRGLNVADHGVSTEILDLLEDMDSQRRSGDFSEKVHVEPHTEVGQIAAEYNRVLDRVTSEIEQRQAAKDALVHSERRTRLIIDTALDGVISIDAEGRITDWNQQAEKIFGWSRDEVLGRDLGSTIIPPHYQEAHQRGLANYLATGEGRVLNKRIEISAMRSDGREFPVELAVSPLQIGGQTSFSAFVRDITERKRAEEQLAEARDKALEASRMKSEFLANMSHEIRTPMNGVIGMASLVLDGELNGEQREYAETIHSSGEALLTIINDILDFSKIEAGKVTIEEIPFELEATVSAAADLLAGRAHEKGMDLVVRCEPRLPPALVGDPNRIRQVLTNLVGNAVKFTDSGHVLVEVRREDQGDDPLLRLSVTDTGVGIPQDKLDHIFEDFTQADASTTRKYGGTGLGLAISRRLAELMGGTVGVVSEVGKGSTFWFTVPLRGSDQKPAQDSGPGATLAGLNVLIVDDNAMNRRVLREQLQGAGLHCRAVSSAREALEELCSEGPDAVAYELAVIDHQMPGTDGLQLGRAIRKDSHGFEPPVMILLSSMGDTQPRDQLQEAGFAACLTKPIRASALIDTLSRARADSVPGASKEIEHLRQATELEKRAEASHQTEDHEEGPRILLAEDNVVNQKVAVRMLEKLGCQVDVAPDGRQAVEMARRFEYQLVLMDCQMPEMDAYQATAEIRRLSSQHHVPIVAMTANAMKGDREKCLAAGMDDYTSKPISVAELKVILDRWARSPVAIGK